MPKIEYVSKRFQAKTQNLIDLCNDIIADYSAQGFSLTLRQLYYRLVSQGHIPNSVRSYKRLGTVISDARLAGIIDWFAIEDRTRSLRDRQRWTSPTEISEAVLSSYVIDRWENQPWRLEVWVEKDALIGVVGQAAGELDVPYFSCRGYTSQSAMWRGAMRTLDYLRDGQRVMIIHLADHDPSGIDMTRDIMNRLDVFWADRVKVKRLALNMDQIDQYQPPPNPAKITDSRYRAYALDFGESSWELDALEPQVIVDLIQSLIISHRDKGAWQEALEREVAMKNVLEDALNYVRENDNWAP